MEIGPGRRKGTDMMGISSSHNRRSLKVMGLRRGTSSIPLNRGTTNMRRRSRTRTSSSTKRLNLVSFARLHRFRAAS
jgi:hypothetical protein